MAEENSKTAVEYGHEFISISHKIKKLITGGSGKGELYHGEFMMLTVIERLTDENKICGEELGAKVGDIGKRLYASKSATSKMLRSLEEKNYIERTTMAKDRRTVFIRLTDKGRKLVTESKEKMDQFAVDVIEELGIEQMDQLIYMMNKLYHIMEDKFGNIFDDENSNNNEMGEHLC